jgi:LPXTG-site transpeptidase (sortase) family protein
VVKRRRRFGRLLVGMGAFLLVAPIAMIGYGTWQESNLTRQWEAQLSTRARHVPTHPQAIPDAQLSVQPDSPPAGAVDFVLKIPRLGYAAAVREGVSSSVLEFGPGHYPTTPEPGQIGDVGVAAHNTYWLGFGGVKPGDRIVLQTRDASTYTYVVTGTRIVAPDETWVLDQPGGRRLTLTTCWPLWAGAMARQRLAIFATLSPQPAVAHGLTASVSDTRALTKS